MWRDFRLSWTTSTDNYGVAGYRLERCRGAPAATFALVASPTTTTHTDAGLALSTTYSYRVRAVDAANNPSGYSNIAHGDDARYRADLVDHRRPLRRPAVR